MAKFYGKIGFYVDSVETTPGVWKDGIVERPYYGEVTKEYRRWQNGTGLNDDLTISNTLSVIADPFAMHHIGTMRYVEWFDTKWEISSVEIAHPRLNVTLGGVYHGDET